MGVPINRLLEDIRVSTPQGKLKRIHLLTKKDVYNIKRDYKIAAHNKSLKISHDMITEIDNSRLVISENVINVQHKVEKFQSFDGCALKCNEGQICTHSYKCSCMNNMNNLNICKHIHTYARTDLKILTQNDNNIVPL